MNLPQGTVLVRGARQLLTLRDSNGEPKRGRALSDLGIVHDGAVLIRDGIIQQVGPSRRLENLAPARGAHEMDATGCVVMPGLIDAHTHLLFPFFPSGGPDDDSDSGANLETVTAKRLESKARLYLDAMARHGSTSVEIKTGSGLQEHGEMKLLRVLSFLDRDPLDIVPTFFARFGDRETRSPEEARQVVAWLSNDLLPKILRRRTASFADYDWSNQPWAEAGARAFIAAAHDLGIPVKVHAGRHTGSAAVAIAVESGAVSVDHVESAGPESLDLLAASGTMGVLLPTTLDHIDRPFTTARLLADAGAAIALGSDFNPGVPGTLSMQAVISLASTRLGLAPEEAISAATINAAYALRRGDKVGSLDPGKAADLLILDTGDYRDLAYHFGHNLVAATIKRGELIYEQAAVSRGSAPPAPSPE